MSVASSDRASSELRERRFTATARPSRRPSNTIVPQLPWPSTPGPTSRRPTRVAPPVRGRTEDRGGGRHRLRRGIVVRRPLRHRLGPRAGNLLGNRIGNLLGNRIGGSTTSPPRRRPLFLLPRFPPRLPRFAPALAGVAGTPRRRDHRRVRHHRPDPSREGERRTRRRTRLRPPPPPAMAMRGAHRREVRVPASRQHPRGEFLGDARPVVVRRARGHGHRERGRGARDQTARARADPEPAPEPPPSSKPTEPLGRA